MHGLYILHCGRFLIHPRFQMPSVQWPSSTAWQLCLPNTQYCYYKAHHMIHLKTQAVKERNIAAGLQVMKASQAWRRWTQLARNWGLKEYTLCSIWEIITLGTKKVSTQTRSTEISDIFQFGEHKSNTFWKEMLVISNSWPEWKAVNQGSLSALVRIKHIDVWNYVFFTGDCK